MGRIKASFTHFLVSVFVVSLALSVVFFLWYPAPYSKTNDIWSMVKILIGVDLVLGPLITLIIFNTKKPRSELKRDLGIIATVQVLALCYGMYAMFDQRPDYLVFGVDRFEVMTDDRVDDSALPPTLRKRPLAGPLVVYAYPGKTDAEKKKLMQEWMEGKGDFTTRRDYYRPVLDYVEAIAQQAVSVDKVVALPANYTKVQARDELKRYAAQNSSNKIYLPLVGKSRSMLAAFDTKTGEVGPVFDVFPWAKTESLAETQAQ